MDVAMIKYYAMFAEWEATFNARDLAATLRDWSDVPFYAVGIYLVLVFPGQEWMKNRAAFNLKPLFIFWNFLLAAFSIIGAAKVLPLFLDTLAQQGFRYTICADSFSWWNVGPVGAWMGLFGVSKIPELFDTVFLVFQKKPVIFLHWYHHTTVMLYCWFAYMNFSSAGIWFGTMNYVVHSIMYSYYFLMSVSSFTRALVRPFAQLITTLQLVQMVGGLICVACAQYWSASEGGCPGMAASSNRAALVMYSSYFVLFGKFFLDNYVWKTNKKRNADTLASPSKKVE